MRYQNDLAEYYSNRNAKNLIIRYTPPLSGSEIIALISCVMIYFILLFTVGFMFLYQLYYLSKNITTIEAFENQKIDDWIKAGSISSLNEYPYNLGWKENFRQIFGNNILLWVFPLSQNGNGIDYKKNNPNQLWPPKEYYILKKYPRGKPKKEKGVKSYSKKKGGYSVPFLTAEDRENMINGTYEYPVDDDPSSTDYDSLDSGSDYQKDAASDDETLLSRQNRLKSE
jgi:hypothetical protein